MKENDTDQVDLLRSEEEAEVLKSLGDEYAERTSAAENYEWFWFLASRLCHKLSIDPFSGKGKLVTGLMGIALFLGTPLILSVVTGEWDVTEIPRWGVVGTTMTMAGLLLWQSTSIAVYNRVSLHRMMTSEAGLRRLIAWDRRWYRMGPGIAFSVAFPLAVLGLLLLDRRSVQVDPIAAGTAFLIFGLLYTVGEITYSIFLFVPESRILVSYKYNLYRFNPVDTVGLRRSIRGYNGVGMIVALVSTVYIVMVVILLPDRPVLAAQIALALLLITYLAIFLAFIVPWLTIKRIVRAQKEREMAPLQTLLNAYTTRILELTEDEYEEMNRLKEAHDQIRNSSESVLPLRMLGQIAASLLLPTITYLLAVASERYLYPLIEQFLP